MKISALIIAVIFLASCKMAGIYIVQFPGKTTNA